MPKNKRVGKRFENTERRKEIGEAKQEKARARNERRRAKIYKRDEPIEHDKYGLVEEKPIRFIYGIQESK